VLQVSLLGLLCNAVSILKGYRNRILRFLPREQISISQPLLLPGGRFHRLGVFPVQEIIQQCEEIVEHRGSEIIIGALYDPIFGPAVMAGAGGILTELYKDVSFRLAPYTKKEAHYLLEELIIYPTLKGYRGLSADVDSLAGIIERVAELASHLISAGCQLDINPIVWSQNRWIALDVKVVLV